MASREIIQFLEENVNAGYSIEQAKEAGIAQGWAVEDVNGAAALFSLRHGLLVYKPIESMHQTTQREGGGFRLAIVIPVVLILSSVSAVAYGYYNNVIFPRNIPVAVTTINHHNRQSEPPSPAYVPPSELIPVSTTPPSEQPIQHQPTSTPPPTNVEKKVVVAPIPKPVTKTIIPSPKPVIVLTHIATGTPTTTIAVTQPVVVPARPRNEAISPIIATIANPGSTPITYQAYPGCQSPDTLYTRTIFIDPVSGSETSGDGSASLPYRTLAEAFVDRKIHPGDKVILLPGDHGKVYVDAKYGDTRLAHTTSWIWIDFMPGATVHAFDIRYVSHLFITNADIIAKGDAFTLFNDYNGDNLMLADAKIHGATNTSGWTAADWTNVPSAITSTDNLCSSFLRNALTNVRFGIITGSRAATTEGTRIKNLIQGNIIHNFSGDGMVPNASDVSVLDNKLYDEYVSPAQGDGNHDDGIQLYALGPAFDNIDIERNWIQETTDPNRPFNAPLQGISQFDGMVHNVTIKNNTVLNSSYYGIVLFGAETSTISNNTIVNSSLNGNRLKLGVLSGTYGNIVKNNIDLGGYVFSTSSVTNTNNYMNNADPATLFTTFDIQSAIYDLHVKSGSAIDGKGVGALPTGSVAINTSLPSKENSQLMASVSSFGQTLWGFCNLLWLRISEWFAWLISYL